MIEQLVARALPSLLGQLDPSVRAAMAAVAELGAGAELIGPPAPAPALRDVFLTHAEANNLPPALLAALSWVLTNYNPEFRVDMAARQIAATRGAQGLAGAVLAWLEAARVPNAREVAGRVIGTFAILIVREAEPDKLHTLARVFGNAAVSQLSPV